MRIKISITILLFLIITIISCTSREENLRNKAKDYIEKIEKFKIENDRLPRSLSEIGIDETLEGPIFYQKRDSSEYILWYGTILGESETYYSTNKKWE